MAARISLSMIYLSMACLLLPAISFAASATGLAEIYAMAKQHDADIMIARSRYDVETQAMPIARANLLPHVDITANTTDIRQKTKGETFGIAGRAVDFNDHNYRLNIRQTLYHRDFYVQFRQAKNSVAKANIDLDAAHQELIIRTTRAYFDVLSAQDTLHFQRSEKEAIARQLERAQKRFEVGLLPVTDVKEAQASYDLVAAKEIEAQNALEIAKDALEAVIAHRPGHLHPLSDRMQLVPPQPDDVEAWVNQALDQNLMLLSSEYSTRIARQEIARQRSNHLPDLYVVMSHSDTDTGGLTGSREMEETRIGLQLNIPLVAGGRTYYKTKEALHKAELARSQHEKVQRKTIQNTRDAFLSVIAGISLVKARARTLESTQAAARAAEAGFRVGTRTSVDVLLALQDTFQARRDYSRARYDYILDTLKLKRAAGTLSVDDLLKINGWLN